LHSLGVACRLPVYVQWCLVLVTVDEEENPPDPLERSPPVGWKFTAQRYDERVETFVEPTFSEACAKRSSLFPKQVGLPPKPEQFFHASAIKCEHCASFYKPDAMSQAECDDPAVPECRCAPN
jgi:hypothetical protein